MCPFVIVCVTSTVESPSNQWLADCTQHREFLSPPLIDGFSVSIDGTKVFKEDNFVEELLVSEGGHERALEILADVLQTFKDKDYSLYEIAKRVERSFRSRYACPSVLRGASELQEAFCVAIKQLDGLLSMMEQYLNSRLKSQ